MSEAERAAIEAGRKYVATRFPDFDPTGKTPVVSDKGKEWEFTYQLPPDMLGGAPVVFLDKTDLQVTRVYRTQ
jgi:hypothetical protein